MLAFQTAALPALRPLPFLRAASQFGLVPFDEEGTVDMDVDFEAEVEPSLGPELGHGAFGRVYRATWRGKEVRLNAGELLWM